MAKDLLKECIIVSKKFGNDMVLAKNRDRAYKPLIEIVHTFINEVEVVYLHDITTDWSEGMNEYGIGIVNSALMVGFDEKEKQLVAMVEKALNESFGGHEEYNERDFEDTGVEEGNVDYTMGRKDDPNQLPNLAPNQQRGDRWLCSPIPRATR